MTIKSSLLFARSLIFPKADKRSSGRRSLFGAVICIGISIIPLIVVLSVSNGMINGMTERIIGLSSSHIQGYISSNIKQIKDRENFNSFVEDFKTVNGVINVFPEIDITGLAAGKESRCGAQIRAMNPDIFNSNNSFKNLFAVEEGSISDYETACEENSGAKVAVIGKKLAENLSIHAGDTFRIITTKNMNGKISPKLTSFKVAAIISSGYQELDALWVFVPMETAYANLSLSSATYTCMIETSNAFGADLVRIQKELKSKKGRYVNFYRWDQVHSAEFENFSSTKVMLIFVMMLIVLVATVNVSSAIVMLVMERRKEIAILKSIGATPAGITVSFLITGMACGCGGVLLGLPIGLVASINANGLLRGTERLVNLLYKAFNVLKGVPVSEVSAIKLMDPAYYIQTIPVDIPFGTLFIIIAATILLSLIVSIIPSVKAGKEKPLDILRKS